MSILKIMIGVSVISAVLLAEPTQSFTHRQMSPTTAGHSVAPPTLTQKELDESILRLREMQAKIDQQIKDLEQKLKQAKQSAESEPDLKQYCPQTIEQGTIRYAPPDEIANSMEYLVAFTEALTDWAIRCAYMLNIKHGDISTSNLIVKIGNVTDKNGYELKTEVNAFGKKIHTLILDKSVVRSPQTLKATMSVAMKDILIARR